MTADIPDVPPVERLLEDGAWLQALARSVIADRATADDVAQDATVIALTKPPREARALRGWIRRVVLNLATDAHRKAARRDAIEAACAAREAHEDAAELVARWEIRRQVVDAVLALDEPYRATLLLRFFEGLDLSEVAARQRVPLDTVKTRQRRALDMLRARLAHLDDGAGRRGFAVLLVLARPDAPTAANTAAAAVTGTVLGGLAMTTLTKSLVAAVVVLALGGTWWALHDGPGGPSTSASGDSSSTATAAATHAARGRQRAAPEPSGPPVPSDLSAFADFDADRDLRGIVVDRQDNPVEGASVTVHPLEFLRWALASMRGETPPIRAPLAESRSAADGSFRLRVTPGAQTLVRVVAKGFADVELRAVETGRTLRVVLDPPTTLRVRVEDAAAKPITGAAVLAISRSRQDDPSNWLRAGTTGADGVIVWEGLPRGRALKFDLQVSPGTGRAPRNVSALPLEDIDVNETVVTIAEGRAVDGRVIDADTSATISGAQVFADMRRPLIATTNLDGYFRVEGWTAVPRWAGDPDNRLGASAAGYAPAWADVPEMNDAKPFTISLRSGFDVTGVVAGPDGRPVVGAQVVAIAKERSGYGESMLDATTDAAGAFRLGWLPRDATTPLTIVAAGFAQAVVSLTPPPKGETTLALGTITVVPGRTVRGRVVDESGAGLRGMHVRLSDPKDEFASLGQFRTSLEDGRFAFSEVRPGKALIRVSGRGPDPMEAKSEIDVPADADPAPITVVYGAAPKRTTKVTLATRVVDEDGQPIADVAFGVGYGVGGSTGALKTRADGTLDVPCEQEPQTVSTYLDGDLAKRYLYQHVWLRPGSTASTMVLKRGEPITGTVVDAVGKPLKDAWVEALVGSRQVGHGTTDAEGRFTCAVPPGSTVDLEARPSSAKYPPPNDIGEARGVTAGATDVTIRVAPVAMDRAIDIVLVLPEGVSAGKCDVVANFQGMDRRDYAKYRATFDSAGRARIEQLPRGPVTLRSQIRLDGEDERTYAGMSPLRVDAEATSVRLVVPGFRIVRGRVVDESGEPSPGASVFSTAAFVGSSAYADADGRFALRLTSEAEAPFLVTATKMPYDKKAPFGGWDIVEAGADRELLIVVRPQPPR